MVDVKKPKEKWFVRMFAYNEDCKYLSFPADYYGCKHPSVYGGGDIKECTHKECPIWHMNVNPKNEKSNKKLLMKG